MSKNLNKAASWIQRQIEELKVKREEFTQEINILMQKRDSTNAEISGLEEVIEKLPVENEKPLV